MNPGRGRNAIRAALLALLLCASPALAQTTNSVAPATNSTATTNDVVGPRELQNFSLGGTVTRTAEPAPAPTQPQATRPVVRESPPTTAAAPDNRPLSSAVRDRVSETPREPVLPPASAPTVAEPSDESVAAPATAQPIAPMPQPDLLPHGDGSSPWSWLAVLAAVAGAGLFYWRRRRQHGELATAGISSAFVASEPVPARPAPRVSPGPARPAADGIVSRSLQPRLAFEFKPLRAEVDAGGSAALTYELVVANAGSAPAREVLVEATMVNAGPRQDQDIAHFFQNPVGLGDRLPMIPPMGRITLRSRIKIGGDKLAPLEVEGRKLLVPLIAFNALYRAASGESQSSASFLVGQERDDGGKMGPLHLDRGARAWTGLGMRPHSAGLQS